MASRIVTRREDYPASSANLEYRPQAHSQRLRIGTVVLL